MKRETWEALLLLTFIAVASLQINGCSASGADTPDPPPVRVTPNPPPVRVTPNLSPERVPQWAHIGPSHSHRCPWDGTVWTHTNNAPNASHNCPTCGRTVTRIYQQFPARRVQVQFATPEQPRFEILCPK